MNHCPNMNAPAIQSGKVSADELDARIADWQQHYAACTANACQSGRAPCPCPDACRVSGEEMEDVAASMWFWGVLAVGLVGAGFLIAGGASLLLDWLRGVMA